MKKVLSILSLTVVAIILGTSLNGCSEDDVTTNSDNTSAIINSSGCIECDNYQIGDKFTLNGVTYIVADRTVLDSALKSGSDLTKYCTSKVTNMGWMFYGATDFNQDISNWDVSNVNTMKEMFFAAQAFNYNIGNWDVSKVTDMSYMFHIANSFNQDIGNWNVKNVTRMGLMFSYAQAFNQDITNWCVRNVDTEPEAFSTNSSLTPENHPVWGTCP